MDFDRRIAQMRAALEATERLLSAPAGRGADPAGRVELRGHLDELRRLLDALEGGMAAGHGARAADGRDAGAC